jgi:hypothetical protein
MQTAITRTSWQLPCVTVDNRRPFAAPWSMQQSSRQGFFEPGEHLPAKLLFTVPPVTARVDAMIASSYDPERPLGYDENVGIDVSEPRRDQPLSR